MRKFGSVFAPSGLSAGESGQPLTDFETWPYLRVEALSGSAFAPFDHEPAILRFAQNASFACSSA
jgi:hypothetical protein